jgi:hypothetical protein
MRFVDRFPCNSGCFSACTIRSPEDPESLRKAPNLSPEPSPIRTRTCSRGWQPANVAWLSARAAVVLCGSWRIGEARLAPGADGIGEARRGGLWSSNQRERRLQKNGVRKVWPVPSQGRDPYLSVSLPASGHAQTPCSRSLTGRERAPPSPHRGYAPAPTFWSVQLARAGWVDL